MSMGVNVPHALYRFFGADDTLLYIGITCDPGSRWTKHAEERPWWCEVSRVTLETFDTRDAVLAAEAAAIRTERPRYNQQHNGTRVAPSMPSPVKSRTAIKAGDVVLLCLEDGAPVGLVSHVDEEWVRMDHYDWLIGFFSGSTVAYRFDEVRKIVFAEELPPATKRSQGYRGEGKVYDMDPLAVAQIRWKLRADPDAAEAAVRDYWRREHA